MDELIERLRTFVVERGKIARGSDIVTACNNSALSLSDLRALLAALEAAREDAERLDWMDIHRGDDVRQDPHSGGPVLVAHYWAIEGQCTDIRAAIDQARGKGVAGA